MKGTITHLYACVVEWFTYEYDETHTAFSFFCFYGVFSLENTPFIHSSCR
uniref:Uncharacterized protein n=1 Tax=Arundo donax TaxID=35708 RepID=A0A0A9H0N0_ARUDO